MKTIVIYRSRTGFTKQYAEWIAAKLKADLFEAARVPFTRLAEYDVIIYGGGLYATGINGVKLIKRNLAKLKGKKVIVFASGASPSRAEVLDVIRNHNFTPAEQQLIRLFYLRGGFDYHKLSPFLKVIMTVLKWSLQRKKNPTPDEQGMLAAYERPVNFTARENIKELIAYAEAEV